MESIGVKEFRENLSRILNRVEQGEIIQIQRHGKKIVELRPAEKTSAQTLLNRMKKRGLLEGGSGIFSRKICTIRNSKPGKAVSDYISEERR